MNKPNKFSKSLQITIFLLIAFNSAHAALISGSSITGTLSDGDAEQSFTLDLTTGQTAIIHVGDPEQSSTFRPRVSLYDSSARLVSSDWGYGGARVSYRAEISGTYRLVIRNASSSSGGNFTMDIAITNEPSEFVLESGSQATGSLSAGAMDSFSFTANAGEYLSIHAGDLLQNGFSPFIRLYGPTGELLESDWDRGGARLFHETTVTGKYTVALFSQDIGSSLPEMRYSLDFVQTGGDSKFTLESGKQATGSLSAGAMDSFSFTANVGEYLSIHAGDLLQNGFSPFIRLYGPTGELLESNWDRGGARLFHETTVTGKYTVALFSQDIGPSLPEMQYTLDFVTTAGASKFTLESGKQTTGSLSAGTMDSFSFTANVGEYLSIHAGDLLQNGFSPFIRLYGPTGELLESNWDRGGARLFHETTVTGKYTVALFSQDIGPSLPEMQYTLDFVTTAGASKFTLESGKQTTGSLSAGTMDSFSFTANAGEYLSIHAGDLLQNGFSPFIRLYGPTGKLLESDWGRGGARLFHETTVTGKYTVALFSQDIGPNLPEMQYSLDFVQTGGDSKSSFGNGYSTYGSIAPGGMNSYSFSIDQPGDITISIDDIDNNGFSPYVHLYSPNGELVYSRWGRDLLETTYSAATTGRYTLSIFNQDIGTNIDSGSYRLELLGNGIRLHNGAGGPASSIVTKAPCSLDDCACNCAGNPINLPQGFKAQFETDYRSGRLAFSRTYRSDSDWTNSDLGVNWRHNYLRKINFYLEEGQTYAELLGGDGAIEVFVKGLDSWQPVDGDIKSRFEEVEDLDKLSISYRLITPSETTETFNQKGQLIRIEHIGGESLNFTYNGSGRLDSVTDDRGRSLLFGYDSKDRISTLDTPDGTYNYAYDENGNLIEITKPDGNKRTYHYEDSRFKNALTGLTDERGVRSSTWGYDEQGRAVLSEGPTGINRTTVTYNDDLSVTTTNALGKASTYHYETILGVRKVVRIEHHASENTPASTVTFNYTNDGLLKRSVDAEGNVTLITYNDRGLESSRTEAADTPEERTTTTTWVDGLRLPLQVSEPGRTTNYEYDSHGRITTVTVTDTNTMESRTTTNTYYPDTADAYGNTTPGKLESVDGPRTDVVDIVSYEYDENFNVRKITNALGHEINITSVDPSGRPLAITDANGVTTTFVYDPVGRLLSQTRSGRTTSYDYDAAGLLAKVTLPDGRTSTFTYDDAKRLIKTVSATGESLEQTLDNADNPLVTVMRDANGNITNRSQREFDELNRLLADIATVNGAEARTDFSYDLNGNITTTTDANGNVSTNSYDALQRLVTYTDARQGTTGSNFNPLNQLTTVSAPNGAQTTFTYNAFGDTTQEISPDRGTTNYSYDGAGNLISKTDARGITATFSYDALNRLTSVSYPDNTENISYLYDKNPASPLPCTNGVGRLCRMSDESGETHFAYDEFGNVVERLHTELGIDYTHRFSYDQGDHLTRTVLSDGRSVIYGRDAERRISEITLENNGQNQTIVSAITYRPDGQETAITFHNGLEESRSYDQNGLLLKITSGTNLPDPVVNPDPVVDPDPVIEPDPEVEPTPVATPDESDNKSPGTSSNSSGKSGGGALSPLFILLIALLTRNAMNRNRINTQRRVSTKLQVLATMAIGASTMLPAQAEANTTYNYDTNWNIVNKETDAGLSTYEYDELNRLISESGPTATQQFDYDRNGNRLSDGTGGYSYHVNSNVMATRHGEGVIHDPMGNMLDNGKGLRFTYNNAGRLKNVSTADGELLATYTYNAFGQRTRKVTTEGTTLYHYDLSGQLIEETLHDGTLQTAYIWRDNKPTAVLHQPGTPSNNSTTDEKTVYLHVDQLNTPRKATDESQTTVWLWESDAFGSTAANQDVDGDGERVKISLRFPGQYMDEESGLYYNWNRYYDPESGRYVRSDPIGILDGNNLYHYGGGNPLKYFDPRGENIFAVCGAIITAAITYAVNQTNSEKISEKVLDNTHKIASRNNAPKSLKCSEVEGMYNNIIDQANNISKNIPSPPNYKRWKKHPYPDLPYAAGNTVSRKILKNSKYQCQ